VRLVLSNTSLGRRPDSRSSRSTRPPRLGDVPRRRANEEGARPGRSAVECVAALSPVLVALFAGAVADLTPGLAAFQFVYTTLFGWFAAFLFLRTGACTPTPRSSPSTPFVGRAKLVPKLTSSSRSQGPSCRPSSRTSSATSWASRSSPGRSRSGPKGSSVRLVLSLSSPPRHGRSLCARALSDEPARATRADARPRCSTSCSALGELPQRHRHLYLRILAVDRTDPVWWERVLAVEPSRVQRGQLARFLLLPSNQTQAPRLSLLIASCVPSLSASATAARRRRPSEREQRALLRSPSERVRPALAVARSGAANAGSARQRLCCSWRALRDDALATRTL